MTHLEKFTLAEAIIGLFDPPFDKNGYYYSGWGKKTYEGLKNSIIALLEDWEEKSDLKNKDIK